MMVRKVSTVHLWLSRWCFRALPFKRSSQQPRWPRHGVQSPGEPRSDEIGLRLAQDDFARKAQSPLPPFMRRCCSEQSRRRQYAVGRAVMWKLQGADDGKANDQQHVAPHGDFMRSLVPGLVLIAVALSCAACGESPTVLTAFRTEELAQTHCPKDIVVWLDSQSGLYYLKGHGSYGRSSAGRYACRTEADAAGMHGMPN